MHRFFTYLLFFLSANGALLAQDRLLHIDLGAQRGFYRASHLSGDIEGQFNPALRGGISFYQSRSDFFRLYAEGGFSGRSFNRNLEGDVFKYRYFSVDLPIYAQMKVAPQWDIQVGVIGSLTTGKVSSEAGANIKQDFNDSRADLQLMGGVVYHFGESWGAGARGRMGFIPMLQYAEVSPDGRHIYNREDILFRSAEIFIRYRFNI